MLATRDIVIVEPEQNAGALITGEELLDMGDIGPCELLDGRIVPMSLTGDVHGEIEAEIIRHLGNFNAKGKNGRVLGREVGVYIRRNPDRVRGVDAAFISKLRQPVAKKGFLEVAPELIVEVVSPNDRWRDVLEKLEEYFSIGVDRVWIVEPESKTVRVFRASTSYIKLTESDTLSGDGVLEGFELPLSELFKD